MFALMRAAEGLMVAHAALALSFLIGSIVFPWCDTYDPGEKRPSETMMRVVGTCAAGFSILGLLAFVVALAGLLRPWVYFPSVGVATICAGVAFGNNFLKGSYWRKRVAVLAHCWDVSSAIAYYALIVLSLPAIVQNFGGSDPDGYHLAYAYEWAVKGKLIVDPFLRLPFYASNFLLLYAVLMSIGGAVFVNYLSWAMGLLAALGVCASAETILQPQVKSAYASIAATALGLAVVIAPANLRWMDTAYIDTAIGAFAALSLVCMLLAVTEKRIVWSAAAALTGAFLIGMKGSFIALLPVYIIVLTVAAVYARFSARSAAAVLAMLVVCAAPWYTRNLILAGDPVPPVFNIMLHGNDGLMTKGEWKQNQHDLSTPHTPSAIVAVPVRAFADPQSRVFREYGVTALMLALYLPSVLLLIGFAAGQRLQGGAVVSALFTLLLVLYWVFTSSLLRYASLFYATLAIALVCCIAPFLRGRRYAGPVVAAACILAMIPSPGSGDFFREFYQSRFKYLPASYLSDDEFLRRFSPDYNEVIYTAAVMRKLRLRGRVYTLGPRVQYDFMRSGVSPVGDWMGPGGYFRLYRAVGARQAAQYLDALGVQAVLIDPRKGIAALTVPLERQLESGGYCRVGLPAESQDELFVRAPAACAAPASLAVSKNGDAAAAKSE